jgi:hypothetical protein
MRDVGIEGISTYLPLYSPSLGDLARARRVDPLTYERHGRPHRTVTRADLTTPAPATPGCGICPRGD